ncbi:MAG TPA: GntR family transcriptional regulator [Stellaceae bacterium]|nr:GntR family transcriptional regulator [Stellaceae bacterium]
MVGAAYDILRRRILSNELPPGARFLEPELAQQLGMSRTPVREALIRLEAEDLVRIIPRRGIQIAPVTAQVMEEIYEIVTALEAAAARRLAYTPTPARLAPLREALQRMDAALEDGDLDAWGEADEAFHRALITQAGNERLAATALRYRDQVGRARTVTLRLRRELRKSNRAHWALLEAIAAGDSDRAGRLHRQQRDRATEELLTILGKERNEAER